MSDHNRHIFSFDADGRLQFIRNFEGMYRACEDPHWQSTAPLTLSYQLVLQVLQRLREELSLGRPMRMIDIGCGLGYFTSSIREALGGGVQVVGLDISKTAIAKAASRDPDIRWVTGDLRALPEWDVKFDVAVSMNSLYYFTQEEIGPVLANVRAMLADRAYLVAAYHLPEKMSFGRYLRSLDDAKALMASAGMKVVYSFDVENELDRTAAGEPTGRHLHFVAVTKEG